MRTVVTILAAAFLLMPCSASLFAQQVNAAPGGDKKIVITKRSTDADGSEVTETIVKKGKAAENFDVEQYIRENRSDKVQVEVRVESADEQRNIRRSYNRSYNRSDNEDDEDEDDDEDDNDEVWGNKIDHAMAWASCDNNRAFLGVEEDSDEDENADGLVVEVVRNSAAAKAGLKTNDLILKLNDQAVNQWADLTRFMNTAKSGDKVRIAYRRNGKDATAEATLTTRKEVKCDENAPKKGFLGVSEDDDDEDKPGVRVSITKNSGAEKAGLQDGDVLLQLNDTELKDWEDISDFMAETVSGDKVRLTYERGDKRNTAEATLGEHQSWDWNDWKNGTQNWNNFNMNSREKPACLGVYTGAATVGETRGAQISSFTKESAAQEATMLESDLITTVNGTRVMGHDDLWNEIAKYNPGDKVKVEYLRGTETRNIEATLKACKDNSAQVIINEINKEGDNQSRRFFTWNWDENAKKQMRESRVITIHRGEGDTEKANPAPAPAAADRKLVLQSFRAYPNPTQGQVTIEFRGESVPTILSLFDLSGRQLFREELNAFDGAYNQQFDLSEYAKGTILIQVLQGDKVYTEQLVVN